MTKTVLFPRYDHEFNQFLDRSGLCDVAAAQCADRCRDLQPGDTAAVLGPEPWRVAYSSRVSARRRALWREPEPHQYYYRVPGDSHADPATRRRFSLQSLGGPGINRASTTSLVEDNWESPRWARGAGLGGVARRAGDHPVTYFQQAGGSTWSRSASKSRTGWSASPWRCRAKVRCGISNWNEALTYATYGCSGNRALPVLFRDCRGRRRETGLRHLCAGI